MSIMDLKGIKNNPKRNGFDLSERVAFTAKVGELLPIMTKEVLPGDKFKINIKAFSRTVPLNTAAYTTIREYYDVFFVPNRLLWNRFDQFITQMPNNQHSAGFNAIETGTLDQQPYFDFDEIIRTLYAISTETSGEFSHNFFGYNKSKLSAKLLNYLGYGNIQHYIDHYRDNGTSTQSTYNPAVNPFPLCAYQKIYQDFYRNNQWEESNPQSYNFDFVSQYTNKNLSAYNAYDTGMFDLRYANYKKDLFTGLMPNAQFSPTASFASVASNPNADMLYAFATNGSQANATGSSLSINNGVLSASVHGGSRQMDTLRIYNDYLGKLSIVALRQAEALQKWNEISQANKYDYKHQLEAHWGVKVSNSRSGLCEYLGGTSSTLDIDGVDNTNITARDDNGTQINKAVVAGKGIGANSGFVDFEAQEHGILMVIYHAIPELDYVNYGINALNTKTKPTDYAIPELDSIGMQEVPLIQLTNDERLFSGLTTENGFLQQQYPMKSIGYAPRYYDYKTSVDTIKGAFIDTYSDWVSPMTRDYIYNYLKKTYDETVGSYLTYTFFKVNPNILFPIIGEEATNDVSTDHLLINASFDVKAVRNLDYNGLPY